LHHPYASAADRTHLDTLARPGARRDSNCRSEIDLEAVANPTRAECSTGAHHSVAVWEAARAHRRGAVQGRALMVVELRPWAAAAVPDVVPAAGKPWSAH